MKNKEKNKPRTQYTKVTDHNVMSNRLGFTGIFAFLLAIAFTVNLGAGDTVQFSWMVIFLIISLLNSGINFLLNFTVVTDGAGFFNWEKDADKSIPHMWLMFYSILMVAVGFSFMKYLLDYIFMFGIDFPLLISAPLIVFFTLTGIFGAYSSQVQWSKLQKDDEGEEAMEQKVPKTLVDGIVEADDENDEDVQRLRDLLK